MTTDPRTARYDAPRDSRDAGKTASSAFPAWSDARLVMGGAGQVAPIDPPASPESRGGATPAWMRSVNRSLVFRCLQQEGPLARVQIARRIGLSRTTVSAIVKQLLAEGLVEEGAHVRASAHGGRRLVLLHVIQKQKGG